MSKLFLLTACLLIVMSCSKKAAEVPKVSYNISDLSYSRYSGSINETDVSDRGKDSFAVLFRNYGLDPNLFKVISISIFETEFYTDYDVRCIQYHNNLRIFPEDMSILCRKKMGKFLPMHIYVIGNSLRIIDPARINIDTTAKMTLQQVAAIYYDDINSSSLSLSAKSKLIHQHVSIEYGYYFRDAASASVSMVWHATQGSWNDDVYIDDVSSAIIQPSFSARH